MSKQNNTEIFTSIIEHTTSKCKGTRNKSRGMAQYALRGRTLRVSLSDPLIALKGMFFKCYTEKPLGKPAGKPSFLKGILQRNFGRVELF
ncbi:unnamed protein product [Ixodes pacificus]